MMLRIAGKDLMLILAASGVLLLSAAMERWLLGEDGYAATVILASALIIAGILETYRRLQKKLSAISKDRSHDFKQIEALLSIFFTIEPKFPLPDTRGWSASPDFLKKLMEVILHEKPRLILEAGSGVSSLIAAYCLKRIGAGKLVSLEHDASYARITRTLLSLHGLNDVATIMHAPLVEREIEGRAWLWYDAEHLKLDTPIGLFLVDGPPSQTQELARYPALPLIFEHLQKDATIILDDGNRGDEQKIVDAWKREFASIGCEFLSYEKGAFLMKKKTNAKGYRKDHPT